MDTNKAKDITKLVNVLNHFQELQDKFDHDYDDEYTLGYRGGDIFDFWASDIELFRKVITEKLKETEEKITSL